jgi:hypothetical protein
METRFVGVVSRSCWQSRPLDVLILVLDERAGKSPQPSPTEEAAERETPAALPPPPRPPPPPTPAAALLRLRGGEPQPSEKLADDDEGAWGDRDVLSGEPRRDGACEERPCD